MNQLYDAAQILMEGTDDRLKDILYVLEDATSPVTKKYREKLYQSIVDRSHVDFGDIPRSKGDITKYSGYKTMTETLNILIALGKDEKSKELVDYATTVITSINNIAKAKSAFIKGFTKKDNYVILDYNLYVYTCVEATTSLISAFVSDLKTDSSVMKIELKDTKYRGDLFFIKNLNTFNEVNKDGKYIKYLNSIIENGKENLFGSPSGIDPGLMVGAGVIALISLMIIPVTRRLIYYYKELKRKLSETLATQAYFLELNKNCIEYNKELDEKKKKKILQKQEKLRNVLLSLSDRLKVTDARAEQITNKQIEKDNKTLTMDGIRDDISDSDISIV